MTSLGNAEIFARNLRRYTDESGKLGKDIAQAIGVSPSTYSDWMNGRKYPRIDKIEKLAAYFHIMKSDLIEDKRMDDMDDQQLRDKLEALHQNPRLGFLFDRCLRMSPEAVEFMIQTSKFIMKEQDEQ